MGMIIRDRSDEGNFHEQGPGEAGEHWDNEMEEFNFQKGGKYLDTDMHFPALKELSEAIKHRDSTDGTFYNYQPGNGTRYDVIFTRYTDNYDEDQIIMVVANMGKMMYLLNEKVGSWSLGYMKEKLGLGLGDCYALVPLINHFIGD